MRRPIENDRVQFISGKFEDVGIEQGTLGYVVDLHDDGTLEVEISDSRSGTTLALLTADVHDVRVFPEDVP